MVCLSKEGFKRFFKKVIVRAISVIFQLNKGLLGEK